jgi:hypothetical protein
MRVLLVDRIPFLRILIGLIVSAFVAAGLVFLAEQLPCPAGPCQNEKFSVGYVGGVGVLALLLSVAAFVLTVAVWVSLAVVAIVSHKDQEPQRLFEVNGDENKTP